MAGSTADPHEQLIELLERWEGSRVMVRIVTAADELVAIFSGRLGPRSDGKQPSLFWPLGTAGDDGAERPGIYLHQEAWEWARVHEGEFVAEFSQSGTTVNVRRIDAARPD